MKTTISRVKALKPHSSGYQNLLNQLGSDFDKDKEFELSSLVGGKNTTSDITWLLGKTNNKRALVEFAVFSAELVLPIYEKMNDSKAPREAIELVKKWLNNESSVAKQELRDTAYAAAAAAVAVAVAAAPTRATAPPAPRRAAHLGPPKGRRHDRAHRFVPEVLAALPPAATESDRDEDDHAEDCQHDHRHHLRIHRHGVACVRCVCPPAAAPSNAVPSAPSVPSKCFTHGGLFEEEAALGCER